MPSRTQSYTIPDEYSNVDELAAPAPVENPTERQLYRHSTLEKRLDRGSNKDDKAHKKKHDDVDGSWLDLSTSHERLHANLTEVSVPAPVEDEEKPPIFQEPDVLESPVPSDTSHTSNAQISRRERASRFATELYTVSYLILFSILGTLARLGLQALTVYPGAPVINGSLWANFGGSLIMGFLAEDRKVFREEWGRKPTSDIESPSSKSEDLAALGKAHATVKRTIPLYIGLATGFCGSFTSFSSFMRDAFLALSNDLPTPLYHPSPTNQATTTTVRRNGGYSFMAVLAIIIITPSLCLVSLQFGAHLALVADPFLPSLHFTFQRKVVDRALVAIAWLIWLGAIFITIFPPDRPVGPASKGTWARETWRSQALFALVLAPLGCLLRFYASLHLNGRISSFPLGTFTVNIFGALVLGMCYDLQHSNIGGRVGCQVLQGVMDGFCGCLTTVSTWVAELKGLRRRHAYIYGGVSVAVALAGLVVVMGSLRWTKGFRAPVCLT
ncbi:MAG: hypothetical protein M1835_000328 [Candelina submexicana]|nr:MAG: hypothetical protein M1835_000328 [Candelina submexicana]